METHTKWIIGSIGFLLIIITIGMAGCPRYNVWQKTLSGKAQLKQAEWNRQIRIKEAEAQKESAKSLGEAKFIEAQAWTKAEIERSKGVAEANKIIGKSLKNNESYLRYLWITGLQDGKNEVVYIPTEAGLPILEAGKRVIKRN